jgi:hypothetical protein
VAATAARRDVELQQVHDRNYDSRQDTLLARMRAVVSAQGAVAAGEHDAAYVLRQALVDLAAIAELVADDLPAPTA